MPTEKGIRVFVSSTFRDMHAEREELIKRIFPQLRQQCERQGITWNEVDLRWGITNEQAAEGQVLPICLTEIDNCRPFFICLLGERYGWVPEQIPPALTESMPWLSSAQGCSVTEIEILHGALNDSSHRAHAFFYFRDPEYGKDSDTPELYRAENEESAEKQAALKQRIRAAGYPVYENYHNAAELGQRLLDDWSQLIQQLFPEQAGVTPEAGEDQQHALYADRLTRFYLPRESDFRRLDQQIAQKNPPLMIQGASGSGKSALVANWVSEYEKRAAAKPAVPVPPVEPAPVEPSVVAPAPPPAKQGGLVQGLRSLLGRKSAPPPPPVVAPKDVPKQEEKPSLLVHYVGATPASTDWRQMVIRLLQRMNLYDATAPTTTEALQSAFINALYQYKGRLILIIDGVDKLEDSSGAPDLLWLPRELPANISLILTSSGGRSLSQTKERGWQVFELSPLTVPERDSFIKGGLAQYRKSLSPEQVGKIANADQSANPLFLRTLLEELRIFGLHERLDERIGYYLEAATLHDLYARLLERYDADYQPDVVRGAVTLLWGARRGLSEAEILAMLAKDGEPLPAALWSPIYIALESHLARQFGLLSPAHSAFREAVEARYLRTPEEQRAIHRRLADYFVTSARQLDEYPWQLMGAEAWDTLVDFLKDDANLLRLAVHSLNDVKTYWAALYRETDYRIGTVYRAVIDTPTAHMDAAIILPQLLEESGEWDVMAELSGKLSLSGDMPGTGMALRLRGVHPATSALNFGTAMFRQSNFEQALFWFREAERVARDSRANTPTSPQQGRLLEASAIGSQGHVLEMQSKPEEALNLLAKAEAIYRELDIPEARIGVGDVLKRRAVILEAQKKYDLALGAYREAQRIFRSANDMSRLAQSLGDEAVLQLLRDDLTQSSKLLDESERLFRMLGNREGLGRVLFGRAQVALKRKQSAEVKTLLAELEALGLNTLRGAVAMLKAHIAQDEKRLPDAIGFMKEAAAAANTPNETFASLEYLVSLQIAARDYVGAQESYDKALVQARQLKDERRIALMESAKLYIRERMYVEGQLKLDTVEAQAQASMLSPDVNPIVLKYKDDQSFISENTRLIMSLSPMGTLEILRVQAGELLKQGKRDDAKALVAQYDDLLKKLEGLIWLQPYLPPKRQALSDLRNSLKLGTTPGATTPGATTPGAATPSSAPAQANTLGALLPSMLEKGIALRNAGDTDGATKELNEGLRLLRETEILLRSKGDWVTVSRVLYFQFQFVWNLPPTADTFNEVNRLMAERLVVARKSGDNREIAEALLGHGIRAADMTEKMKLLKEAAALAQKYGYADIAGQANMQINLFGSIFGKK